MGCETIEEVNEWNLALDGCQMCNRVKSITSCTLSDRQAMHLLEYGDIVIDGPYSALFLNVILRGSDGSASSHCS